MAFWLITVLEAIHGELGSGCVQGFLFDANTNVTGSSNVGATPVLRAARTIHMCFSPVVEDYDCRALGAKFPENVHRDFDRRGVVLVTVVEPHQRIKNKEWGLTFGR